MLDGFVEPPEAHEDDSEVVVGFCRLWIERQRVLVVADGFLLPSPILQQVGEVPMRLREIRLQPDRVTEV